MQRTASYHRAAIQYNEKLAEYAGDLAEKLEHEEVRRWCRSVSKQHVFHARRHQRALDRIENKKSKDNGAEASEVSPEPTSPPVESSPDPEKAAEPVESSPDPEDETKMVFSNDKGGQA